MSEFAMQGAYDELDSFYTNSFFDFNWFMPEPMRRRQRIKMWLSWIERNPSTINVNCYLFLDELKGEEK